MIPKLPAGKSKRTKPPACDFCKARRVLCHPQPNGAPCPRCVEKNNKCTTTPRRQLRTDPTRSLVYIPIVTQSPQQNINLVKQPAWNSVSSKSNDCPDLNPELVRHLFDCFVQSPQYLRPVIHDTCISTEIQAASFQLNVLSPRSRALALCIIAFASLISFDEAVLGPGPRPYSLLDAQFFLSDAGARSCGVRRAAVFRALHSEAVKTAVNAGVMLEFSSENIASCFILSYLEQYKFCDPVRPWASAFYSHLRILASTWKAQDTERNGHHWAAFLMEEALFATKHRKPILISKHDQLLICGPEPCSLQALLATLEKCAGTPHFSVVFHAMKPFLFHVTCLMRQLHETIIGDHPRLYPLSEAAVLDFMGSLSIIQTILSLLIEQVDAALLESLTSVNMPYNGVSTNSVDAVVRLCGFVTILGFTGILLPFYRELERRINVSYNATAHSQHACGRLLLLRNQAREMSLHAARSLAKGLGYLPRLAHMTHMLWLFLAEWAEFCLDEADAPIVVAPEDMHVLLKAIAAELNNIGYSLDLTPHAGLVERLQGYISGHRAPAAGSSLDLLSDGAFPLLDDSWMDFLSGEGGTVNGLDLDILTFLVVLRMLALKQFPSSGGYGVSGNPSGAHKLVRSDETSNDIAETDLACLTYPGAVDINVFSFPASQ
ncbi:hypothetical protein C8J57DRAFT_1714294 [Mycena rebaudengoi]|nr:hypothetical protein C8J57DRAFT_1714294 [Mycena rebaudengoi]